MQKISGKGREEAKTQIEYLVSGQAGLDDVKKMLREIVEQYKPKPGGGKIELPVGTIKFRVPKIKLLEAFKDELGDEKQTLESFEAEELVVEIKLS